MKRIVLVLLALFISAGAGWGTEMVYTPVNPSFGGNPINGGFLLGSAEAQNKFTAPKTPITIKNPIDTFKDSLLNRALNTLSSRIIEEAFGKTIDGVISPGPYVFGDLIITVNNSDPNILSVTIAGPDGPTTIEVPAFAELR